MAIKRSLSIIKIGGDIIDDSVRLEAFYEALKTVNSPVIIVHGGGNKASVLQEQLGIQPQKIEGRRITDTAALDVVTMVYAGLLNKKVVAGLQNIQLDAIGLSGADGDAIRAHKREVKSIDYGFVGDIDFVNVDFIETLLSQGKTPVFCAITHDGNGQLLNTNADTLASKIAIAMTRLYTTELLYGFTKSGVLENMEEEDSLVSLLDRDQYAQMKKEKKIIDGMIPKLDTAFEALSHGVTNVRIGHTDILGDLTIKHTRLCL